MFSHFMPGSTSPKWLLHRLQGGGQVVGVLLAQGVEVQPIQQLQGVGVHLGVPHLPGHPHAAAGGAGVVDGVSLLGGALGIDAQPHTFPRRLGPGPRVFSWWMELNTMWSA